MKVIGTAGHVDHGKSQLVLALTGIDPDRLEEEKLRQMTIDLGFAWMKLPGGEDIGIIDVPGHRDFIENMLAGVGGIDATLFVIAADEGVMPQTREHLAILDLLEIKQGVVALTKVDLVEDEDWIDLVSEEVRELLKPTNLAKAPIVPVSIVTGQGIPELVAKLESSIAEGAPRRNLGRPRLPIDRAFTISGFGTVVTGTLIDGNLVVGQEVEILPAGLEARVRGLQTHQEKIKNAIPGSRVAVNISGVEVRQLKRGDVVCTPGDYMPTRLLDVRFRLLVDAVTSLRHNMQVKLFLGAAQRLARVRVLEREALKPGEGGWLQLALDRSIVAARGDHFILRRPSPGATLGGGRVVNPHPSRRYKRSDKKILDQLQQLLQGTPGDILTQSLDALSVVSLGEALEHARLEDAAATAAITELTQAGELILFGEYGAQPTDDTLVTSRGAWEELLQRFALELQSFHKSNPLRVGMPREELKSKLGIAAKSYPLVLEKVLEEGVIIEEHGRLRDAKYEVVLLPEQQAQIDRLLARFHEAPYTTPSVKECLQAVGTDLLTYLFEISTLIQLSADVVFRVEDYEQMVADIRRFLEANDTIKVGQVRDLFATSRKYALALMEHLDSIGLTVREGDERRLS
ncbi:MAG: selenocysteine-specific translation elongation factor [Anaerolineales bacterium]|nr:selenocysteine-specific translation elongation factor [Anaerolineales bacterium]